MKLPSLVRVASMRPSYVCVPPPVLSMVNKLAGSPTGDPPAADTILTDPNIGNVNGHVKITPATPSKALGFSSKNMLLTGGTVGGPQSIENLSSISIGSDGVITALHPVLGDITVGRLDLVTFANPSGLVQSGNSYFMPSANSGTASFAQPGSDGAGALAAGSLELSNVDLSREFADMITTQRGFQVDKLFQNLVRHRNQTGVCLKAALRGNQVLGAAAVTGCRLRCKWAAASRLHRRRQHEMKKKETFFMIVLTKLNDVQFVLNSDLIETVFETPDTTIHLTNGNLYIVKEKMEEIIQKTIAYRCKINEH